MSSDRWFESDLSGLLTDLYEINMGACYFEQAMQAPATFSLFVRKLPENRSFLVAAGLEEALQYLEDWKFTTEAIDYLHSTKQFGDNYLEFLAKLRFTGDVAAVPEGTVVFANEPILEVTAPIIEAQIVETYLLSALQLQTLIASKAARIMIAAGGRNVVDFGSRRAHGMAAALKIARTSYMVGFAATSNVLAGKQFGIPITGTLAHSFIQAFDNEIQAFRAFAKLFPENTVLLIDTYDTLAGARRAVEVGQEMSRDGKKLRGVRLDSGDVVRLSTQVRKILDDGGLHDAKIYSSGSLNEYRIADALKAGAPIDAFGVGSHLAASFDSPELDMVYKLVEYDARPVLKLSPHKRTLAGPKQIFRRTSPAGEMVEDVLATRDEQIEGMEPLLVPVMETGKRAKDAPSLHAIREYTMTELSKLPKELKAIRTEEAYPVRQSERLRRLQKRLVDEYRTGK